MKKLVLASIAFALLPSLSRAQDAPKVDIAAGYSQLLVVRGISLLMNGGSGSVALNVNNWLGVGGDFGVYNGSPGVAGLTAETYTFGPRFSYRKLDRFIPFAQVLFGGQHASAVSGGFNGLDALAFGTGVGADIGLGNGGRLALRPQAEYFGFRSNGNTTNTVRLSIGIVFYIARNITLRSRDR
jgi:hypothetical protein